MNRVFEHPDVPQGKWDFVFNLGGETAVSQSAEIYRLRITQLSAVLGQEASRRGVGVFVEVSTGMVYAPDRKPRTESDKLKPWLRLAKAKLEAEEELMKIGGLNVVVVRLAHVYGKYNWGFLAKTLCLARVFQEQDKELKWLWTEDLRINTVWVGDVVRALWKAAQWKQANDEIVDDGQELTKSEKRPAVRGSSKEDATPETPAARKVPVFNIVDHGQTSQGVLADLVSKTLGIKTGFQGSLISQFVKLNLDSVVDDLNDEILQPWAEMCEKKGITSGGGPLSPFVEKEWLKDHDLSLDGTLFEKTTGFTYERERLDEQGIREMLRSYEDMGWWP